MAESVTPKQFLAKNNAAVAEILKKHKIPAKPAGGVVKKLNLMGFVLDEAVVDKMPAKNLRLMNHQVVEELGGEAAMVFIDKRVLVGFIGKPKGSVFKL